MRGPLIFALLGLVLPTYFVLELPWFFWDAATFILLSCLVYTSARLAVLAHDGEKRIVSLTFWLFVYAWGTLAPFLQVGADVFPWKRRHTEGEQLLAAAMMVVALLAYDAGGWLARRRAQRERPQAMPFSLQRVFAIGLVAVVTTSIAIAAVGGPAVLLQPRGDTSAALWQETGNEVASRNLVEAVLRGGPYVAFVALLFSIQRRWRELKPRGRLLLALAFAAVLPLMLIANYPDALTRGWLGTVALSIAFLLVPWRRWTMALLIAALVCAFVLVFPYSDRNRVKSEEAKTRVQTVYSSAAGPLIVKGDYDVFVQLVNATIYVEDRGYTWGGNLAAAFLFWVPRKWWPGKPLNTGFELGLHMQNPVLNLSAPLWVEGFLAFGGAGVLGVMLAYGFITRGLEERYLRQRQLGAHWGLLQIVAPFWAGYQVFFMRGPLLNSIAYSSFAVFLFLILAGWRRVPLKPVKNAADPQARPA